MATLLATADGNWLTAATWGLVDATALLDSEAGSTTLTNAYVESQTFTPGAITIDGIAVKVATRAAVPSGTMSVRLSQAAATVAGTEVTINVSDIDSRNAEQGWYFFKFAAPVLLVAATLYTVAAKTSVASQVGIYRNATPGNWARLVRTTTTQAPAAGDHLHICGEWTAAATKTDRTVTMNETAATDYGDNSKTQPPGLTVNKGGTLTWATTAATTFILRLSTKLFIYTGGVMNMGTVATPCPRDGAHQLEFNCDVADGDFGIQCYGTWVAQGLSRTSGKDVTVCKLNTDEAAAQTTLGVDTDTGWKSGDLIAIAGTTRTATEAENRVLNGDAAASTVTVTVGLTNAHSGTSPTQAHVILLTRNVRVESTSTTLMAYVYTGPAAIIDWDWVGFRYLGATTSLKRGIEVDATVAGTFNMNFCSFFQVDNWGLNFVNAAGDVFTATNCVGYAVGISSSTQGGVSTAATTGSNWTLTDIYIIGDNTTGPSFYLLDAAGTISRLYGINSSKGLHIEDATARIGNTTADTFECYGNQGPNIDIVSVGVLKMSNVKFWRSNSVSGMQIAACQDLEITGLEAFGNSTANINWTTAVATLGKQRFRSIVLSGDSTFATNTGFDFGNSAKAHPEIVVENSDFGVATGIKVTHATQDVQFGTSLRFIDIRFIATRLASGTEFANSASLIGRSRISRQRIDDVTNTHNTIYPAVGTVAYNTAVVRTSTVSQKLTPSGATAGFRLRSAPIFVPVEAAALVKTVGVYVQKDGSYVGSAVRLVLLANPAMGQDTDVVLDTMAGAASVWELLSGDTPSATEAGAWQVVVEVDGSAGNVYVTDAAAAAA